MKKQIFFIFFTFILLCQIQGQNRTVDSIQYIQKDKFRYKALIIPAALLVYGIVGLESHALIGLNTGTRHELNEHIDTKFSIDDISQYTPMAGVYALNILGLKGKNSLKDRTIILGTAYIIMGTSVTIIKNSGTVIRPDSSSNNSFPSGHTATAFMGAEFLFREYKDQSVWYGIAGYVVAAGTGFFRMYNNRHWLTDVAAGAGIGILSTQISYWVYPWMKRTIFKDRKNVNGMILPYYNGNGYGVGMSMVF